MDLMDLSPICSSREREKIEDLSPAEKKQIRDKFGVPLMEEIDVSVLSPPTPSQMIDRAADFLTKQKDKGFLSSFEANSYKKMFMRSQFQSEENKRPEIDLMRLYETEPFQRFWMNTKYVKDSMKQISKLQFPVVEDMKTVRSVFLDRVISTVRRLQSAGILDKQKRDDQMKAMRMFLEEAKEAKRNAIQFALDERMITPERLPRELLQACEVRQSDVRTFPRDRNESPKLMGSIAMPVRAESNIATLPREMDNPRRGQRISRAILGKNKQIVVPQMKQRRVGQLGSSPDRENRMNNDLKRMMANDLCGPRRSQTSLAEQVEDGPTLTDTQWSTAGLTEEHAREQKPESELPTADEMTNLEYIPTGKGDRFCENLQRVWNELGFTVKQRLAHVVKYTEDLAQSVKLEDALNDWNIALSCAKRYERSYQEYKKMLRQNLIRISPEQLRIARKAVDANAEALAMVGRQLQAKFDDDLIYRGVTASELFEKRALKLAALEETKGV